MGFARLRYIHLFSAFALALPLAAQQPALQQPEPPPPNSLYTLNVFTNLIQLPTMVLGVGNEPVPAIAQDRFRLRIDGGPWFKPVRMHTEDAEPLMLGVLLDDSGTEPLLLREAPSSLSTMAQGPLNPADRIALFSFDCEIAKHNGVILPDANEIRATTQQVLGVTGLHAPGPKAARCTRDSRLIDAIAVALGGIVQQGTRRALIVLTDGFEHKSKHTWDEVTQFALSNGVAIFVIRTDTYVAPPYEGLERRESLSALRKLSLGTGGLILETTPDLLPTKLAKVVSLLRARYILEFPRPGNATGGYHRAEVKVTGKDVVTIFSGVQAKLPDDDELKGTNTIPHDSTNDPQQGKHSERN